MRRLIGKPQKQLMLLNIIKYMTKTYRDLLNKLKNMNESQAHIEHVNKKGFSLYILRTCKN